MGYLYMTLLQIPTESTSERILKIGQYLVKLWARVRCLVFLTHGVEHREGDLCWSRSESEGKKEKAECHLRRGDGLENKMK